VRRRHTHSLGTSDQLTTHMVVTAVVLEREESGDILRVELTINNIHSHDSLLQLNKQTLTPTPPASV